MKKPPRVVEEQVLKAAKELEHGLTHVWDGKKILHQIFGPKTQYNARETRVSAVIQSLITKGAVIRWRNMRGHYCTVKAAEAFKNPKKEQQPV